MPAALTPAQSPALPAALLGARNAVASTFFWAGAALATWASRIPDIRHELGLSERTLGFLLFGMAAGAVLALLFAGRLADAWGTARVIRRMGWGAAASILLVTAAIANHAIPVVVVGLFCFGVTNAIWDVAMNLEGAIVEKELGYTIMPRFHAAFSLGTVAGAVVGVGAVRFDLPVPWHLAAGAVGTTLVLSIASRAFGRFADVNGAEAEPDATLGAGTDAPDAEIRTEKTASGASVRPVRSAWQEPRTLLIGFFVLCITFSEGAGNDWLALAMVDGHGVPTATGVSALAVFLTFMTVARWWGGSWVERWGRVPVLQISAAVASLGVALVALTGHPFWGFIGAALWGLGSALGFPLGMTAACDDPVGAAQRLSVVAAIGYLAFLGGPTTIGFLAEAGGVPHALLLVLALCSVAVLLARSLQTPDRPLST